MSDSEQRVIMSRHCGLPTCQKEIEDSEAWGTCARCRMVLYCSEEHQGEDWRHWLECAPPYKVVDVPGKGEGLVATQTLERGDIIVHEKPKHGQSDCIPMHMYQVSCRINHSCSPNSYGFRDAETDMKKVCVLQMIEEGEEITVDYVNFTNFEYQFERKAKLLIEWDFLCRLGLITSI